MPDDIAIKVENLTKTYRLYNSNLDRVKESLHPLRRKYHHEFRALSNVSFQIKKGDTVGIIGINGSGKSTLLKIICGVLTPAFGSVTVNGRISALLELGAGFNPELTGIENVYFNGTLLGYCREEMTAKLDEILAFADIGEFANQPVKTYSSGMFVRLAFSVATVVDPDIVIVDEALAVGDVFFQQKCYKRLAELRKKGVTIVFVTHSMSDVIQFCQQTILLNDGNIVFMGESTDAVKRYLVLQQKELLDSMIGNLSDMKIKTGVIEKISGSPGRMFWPTADQFMDITNVDVVSNDVAKCTGVALCSDSDAHSDMFYYGDIARLYCEFTLNSPIGVPIAGFTIRNEKNIIVHGKNCLHYDELELPEVIIESNILRFKFDIELTIAPGEYVLNLSLSTMNHKDYEHRNTTPIDQVQSKTVRLCHLSNLGRFKVIHKPPPYNQYSIFHAGLCNLNGKCELNITMHANEVKKEIDNISEANMPTIFHVTHWKAGSQWIKKILRTLAPDRYIESQLQIGHFLNSPLQEGKIYTAVYVTKDQFESVELPKNWCRFVVIRDLRDTLVSGYFSLKVSHA